MKLQLHDGQSAMLSLLRGEFVTVRSAFSSPPGSTIELRSAEVAQPYQVKVRSCRRDEADGLFVIEGRCVNLSRRQREVLEAAELAEP